MLGCGFLTGRDHPLDSLILGAVNVAKMSLRTYHLNLKLLVLGTIQAVVYFEGKRMVDRAARAIGSR